MGCGASAPAPRRYATEVEDDGGCASVLCDSDEVRDYLSAEALYSRSGGSVQSEPGLVKRWFRETSTIVSARINHGITGDVDQFEPDDECYSHRKTELLNKRVTAWLQACREAATPPATSRSRRASPPPVVMVSLIELTPPEEIAAAAPATVASFVSVATHNGQRRASGTDQDSTAAMSWPSFTFASSITDAPVVGAAVNLNSNNLSGVLLKKGGVTPTTSKRLLRPQRLTTDAMAQHAAIGSKGDDSLHPSVSFLRTSPNGDNAAMPAAENAL